MASPFLKPDLLELGKKLLSSGPHKTLKTPKRIRILFNGVYVADTTAALYVWEHPYYPYYYVPLSSFAHGVLHSSGGGGGGGEGGSAAPVSIAEIKVGARSTDRVLVFGVVDNGDNNEGGSSTSSSELSGMARVEFAAADAWFEEDERIYVHPKDPFRRVEILHSARPVRVSVGGVRVASAASSLHLYETGLPCRYYLPATAVDPAVLRDSGTSTECPYKGVASYYDVVLRRGDSDGHDGVGSDGSDGGAGERTFKDVVWYYRTPTLESALVAGYLCFYNEKVDIELDGKMLERPTTHFS